MSENDIALAERRQQILTIEPAEYVAQVFEPFTNRLTSAIAQSRGVSFDVTTSIGMATAKRYRAIFRDLRVESEEARKERKAPILEIGRLLDSRAKEIKALIDPHESRFDTAIKNEEARKEAEKQAKLEADRQRVLKIQDCIREFRVAPSAMPGKTAAEFRQHAVDLANTDVTEEFFQEFHQEALTARDDAVIQMRLIADQAEEREREAAKIAAERAELERLRAAQAEQERIAAAKRAAEDRKAREEQDRAAEAMRREQAAHAARMAEQQAALDRQQAEIEAEKRRQADAEAARRRAEVEAAEAAERAEQARREQERQAAEQMQREAALEAARRAHVEFEKDGPAPEAIIETLADGYDVMPSVALAWLRKTNWKKIEVSQ